MWRRKDGDKLGEGKERRRNLESIKLRDQNDEEIGPWADWDENRESRAHGCVRR